MPPSQELLTTGAAAESLGVSDETLRRWAKEGLIRHVKTPSGRIRFRPSDLDEAFELIEAEPKAAS